MDFVTVDAGAVAKGRWEEDEDRSSEAGDMDEDDEVRHNA